MSTSRPLLAALSQDDTDLDNEETIQRLTELVKAAVNDKNPLIQLEDIYRALAQHDGIEFLDAFAVIPEILPCTRMGTVDLVTLIADQVDPREIVVIIQEVVEYLQSAIDYDEEDTDGTSAPVTQIIHLVILCARALPRSRIRRTSAYGILQPVMANLELLISTVGHVEVKADGRRLLREISTLITTLFRWVETSGTPDDAAKTKICLSTLADTTVRACVRSIRASLAARLFEQHFSRLIVTSAVEPDWEEGHRAMLQVINALSVIGITPGMISPTPAFSQLIYLAHSPVPLPPPIPLLHNIHSLLLTSIQMNLALDESLFLLLSSLSRLRALSQLTSSDHMSATTPTAVFGPARPPSHAFSPSSKTSAHPNNNGGLPSVPASLPRAELPVDIVSSLSTVLPSLASTHTDPFIRHVTLRTFSLLLWLAPPTLRLEILLELTSESAIPQMRAAAIGLVKEAVLDALEREGSGRVNGGGAVTDAANGSPRSVASSGSSGSMGSPRSGVSDGHSPPPPPLPGGGGEGSSSPDGSPTRPGLASPGSRKTSSSRSVNAKAKNPFASPLLLQAFGPVLFRTIPDDYLVNVSCAADLEESLEPSRIAESLSLYYVIVQRDVDNRTGVRDTSSIESVEASLLRPLRLFLEDWLRDHEPILPLVSLKLGLDRVDEALAVLRRQGKPRS
ncbi:hypothetical protein CONPUDRAFT_92464 [Coniophora puteana RWD-64-598 SS2]|uniref:Uncharacterized protein n=1 Tax=Coniophora puteana (strain RWD-64-598) TaxID=741705 RepID=A0A5M3MDU4_CONPW|nr:uncharacterized protein CONPUDRAFT_92464 [Coniophora puteana RWD-64-598 SS2]EIW77303.1 hypothetical protein CONPUDRAFT_92464 [Coniophora puteana RWD-64-598 SS2]